MLPSDRSSDGSILTWTQNNCNDLNGYELSDDFMRFPAVDITAELWYDGSGGSAGETGSPACREN